MSPELFKYEPYGFKSDVWSLGCCLYEMCTFKHAFDAKSFQALAVKILKGNFRQINKKYSKELKELIYTLM
jgi:serine/threonine protein kinase